MAAIQLMRIIAQNQSNFNITWRSAQLITFNNVLENYISVSDDATAYLFTDGCITATGKKNCTEVCLNATHAFESQQNLQNCMQYANIAKAISEDRIEQASLDFAHAMGISPGSNSESVYTTVHGCLQDYDNYARKGEDTILVYKDPPCVGFNGTSGGQTCYTNICAFNSLSAQINADVGGIGVYASYYIQSGTTLLFWLGFKFSSSWTFWMSWPVFMLRQRTNASRRAQDLQARCASRMLGPLITTAVDFQRAQCFFMLALQMAALIILFHNGQGLGNSSLQQVTNNYHLIGCLSLGGTLPVSFLLACLHIADRRSWYTFILSLCTMAVSTTTLIYSRTSPVSEASIGESLYQPPSCGTSNPTKYCMPFDNGEGTISWMVNHVGTTACCWAVLILLIIDIQLHTYRQTSRVVHYSSPQGSEVGSSRKHSSRASPPVAQSRWASFANPPRIWKFWMAISYQIAEIAYIYGFSVYAKDLGVMNFYVSRDWAFGQIIAITVWGPTILEFIYLELHGMKRGLEYRISKQWKLIDIDDLEDSDEDSDSPRRPSRISRFLQHPWSSVLGFDVSAKSSTTVRRREGDEYSLVSHQDKETPPLESGPYESLRVESRLGEHVSEGRTEGAAVSSHSFVRL